MYDLLHNDPVFRFAFAYAATDIVFFILAVAILASLSSDIGREAEVQAFRKLIYAYFGFIGFDLAWVLHNYHVLPGPGWLNSLFSVLNMSCVTIMAYYWFIFGELRLRQRWLEHPGFRMAAKLPLVAIILLFAVSPFTGWIFSVGPDGSFRQGPFYVWQLLLDAGYLLWVSAHALHRACNTSYSLERRECLTLVSFFIPPFLAGIVDSMVPTMPIIVPAVFASILFVFISLQDNRINSDALTGMNNRRRAERLLEEKLAGINSWQGFYVFLGDINSFKRINDGFGHNEGDNALQLVARCLQGISASYNIICARWGGDEFVLIADREKIGEPGKLVNTINARLARMAADAGLAYELSMSFGHAHADATPTTAAILLADADAMLYEAKHCLHNNEQ